MTKLVKHAFWCDIQYVIPQLKCQHSGMTLVLIFQPHDDIFEYHTYQHALSVQYSHKNCSVLDQSFKNRDIAKHLVHNHKEQCSGSKNKYTQCAVVITLLTILAITESSQKVFNTICHQLNWLLLAAVCLY